ncbi:MAG: FUSC family protein, partial [Gaiellales bacterium]
MTAGVTRLPSRRQWGIAAGFLALLIAPLALIGLAFDSGIALAALPGVAVGFVVTLQARSLRVGLLAVALMGALSFVSTLASASTVTGAIWLGLIGVAYGLSGLRGWHRLTMQMAIWCAYVVVNPLQANAPSKLSAIRSVDVSLTAATVTATAVLIAGALMALLVSRIAVSSPARPFVPLRPAQAWAFAIASGLLLTTGAAVVLDAARFPAGEWLLLTMIVLFQPDLRTTLRHTAERTAGTLGGVLAAAVLTLALGDGVLATVLALILMVAAFAYLQMPNRY